MPWYCKADLDFFRSKTVGKGSGRNAVIMGRKTYETIPPQVRPLKERHNVVISRKWEQAEHPEISVYSSIIDALAGLGGSSKNYDAIWIAGGESIYQQVVRDYMYLCDKIYVTHFKANYECDQFFPLATIRSSFEPDETVKARDYNRLVFNTTSVVHGEYAYLTLLRDIRSRGEITPSRTGETTRCMFGASMNFDIRSRIPFLTTKRLYWENCLKELLWIVSGDTDTRNLEKQGVKYWKGNTSRSFLDDRGLTNYVEGDLGPGYGFQWRHWGAEYKGCDENYKGFGIDQLANLIEQIKMEPHSRRHLLSAWNVAHLDEMALPPCHLLVQFHVSGDGKWLDCALYQRSGDMFLGIPFNICMYSVLTYMVAHLTGLRPRKFTHFIGDAHIYRNHDAAVDRQLRRTPRPFPRLSFNEGTAIRTIDDFTFDSFNLEGYTSWPSIKGIMAI